MRRTPALTAEARRLFVEELQSNGWVPGWTIKRIADATGLSQEQVRDATLGKTADEWRQSVQIFRHHS